MSDLSKTVAVCHGETDQSWELTTSLPTECEQGIILLQVAAGTDPVAIREIHRIIESTVEGVLGE